MILDFKGVWVRDCECASLLWLKGCCLLCLVPVVVACHVIRARKSMVTDLFSVFNLHTVDHILTLIHYGSFLFFN